MRFNAKKFSADADGVCRRLISEPHRQALNGKEVINGKIEYEIEGEKFYLYPVLPEWCDV